MDGALGRTKQRKIKMMTAKETTKTNRIAKLQNDLRINCEMLVEARSSVYQQLMFPVRNAQMIAAMEQDNARILRNLARLGVK